MANGQVIATPILSLPQSGGLAPYLRVVLDTTLLILKLAGPNDRELGTVDQGVPASGLGTSSVAGVVDRKAHGTVRMLMNGAGSKLGRVYGAANGKVSATPNGNFIGLQLEATTADGDWVEVLRAADDPSVLFANQVASTAVANSAVETLFDQNFTLPANLLRAGDRLLIKGQGIAPATNSTDTLLAKLKIGSTVIAATAAVDVANNDLFYFEAELVCRTAGASGTIVGAGLKFMGTPGTASVSPFALASTAIDTTATQQVGVSATWSVANAGDSCRLDVLTIEHRAY